MPEADGFRIDLAHGNVPGCPYDWGITNPAKFFVERKNHKHKNRWLIPMNSPGPGARHAHIVPSPHAHTHKHEHEDKQQYRGLCFTQHRYEFPNRTYMATPSIHRTASMVLVTLSVDVCELGGSFMLLLVLLDIQHTSRQRDCLGLCWACVRAPFRTKRKFTDHFGLRWCGMVCVRDRIRKGIAAMFPEQYQFFFSIYPIWERQNWTLGTATEHTGHIFDVRRFSMVYTPFGSQTLVPLNSDDRKWTKSAAHFYCSHELLSFTVGFFVVFYFVEKNNNFFH